MKKAECPQTKTAVVIDGADAGKVLHVCRDEQCKVHARVSHYEATPKERAARAKELLAERTEKLTRLRILNAIRKKLPAQLSRPDLKRPRSITSGGWAMTITAVFAESMDGRRTK